MPARPRRARPAHRHADHACIVDPPAEQRGVASARDLDRALVRHRRRLPVAAEDASACHEVLVRHVEGGGHEGARLHRTGRGDGDAVRVDEVDLPVGVDLAGDGRGRRPGHPVEERRGGRGLADVDAAARADGEALPVDDRGRRRLLDRHLGGRGRGDTDAAVDRARPMGQLARNEGGGLGQGGAGQKRLDQGFAGAVHRAISGVRWGGAGGLSSEASRPP